MTSRKRKDMPRRSAPPSRGPKYEFLRVKTGAVEVVVLSEWIEGFDTHWVGRGVICTGPRKCVWHQSLPVRWRGYLSVLFLGVPRLLPQLEKTRRCILELTEEMGRRMEAIQAERGSLRGCVFHLERSAPTAKVKVDLRPQKEEGELLKQLPKEEDVEDAVRRLYRVDREPTVGE